MQVGVSGAGRIGRLFIRRALSQKDSHFEIGVINATCSANVLAHLLMYDTVHGKWDADIEAGSDHLVINGRKIAVVSERDPSRIPWKAHGVELVIDATGKFKDKSSLGQHLDAGASRVILTCPGQVDFTVVMGVNETGYDPDRHRLVSAASCTTNCLAPVLSILDRAFGVKRGWMTTIHAYTNDQKHLDNPHKDLRRARSCTNSIIPTTTGVSKALADVLPHLAPHMKGISVRVPTQDVSVLDLQVDLKRSVQQHEVAAAFQEAAAGRLGAYVAYSTLPLVSADYIGNDKSAVIDGLSIMTHGDQVKLLAWYDNEWAYASRVVDLARYIATAGHPQTEGGERCVTQAV